MAINDTHTYQDPPYPVSRGANQVAEFQTVVLLMRTESSAMRNEGTVAHMTGVSPIEGSYRRQSIDSEFGITLENNSPDGKVFSLSSSDLESFVATEAEPNSFASKL